MTVREEAVTFGTGGSLIGIVSHPEWFDTDRPGILLLPPCYCPRSGPLRLLVMLGRRLAGLGFLCLRFDFSGVGESASRQDEVPRMRSDMLETILAMDFLEATFGVQRFACFGLGRGAGVCFATAVQDPRVIGLMLIQPEILVVGRRQSAIKTEQSSLAVFQSMTRLSSWMRLLRGQTDYRSPLAMLFVQIKARLGLLTDAKRKESDGVAATIAMLSARRVQILFIFSPEHVGYQYLQTVLRSQMRFRQPPPGMRIELTSQRGHHLINTQDGQRALLQVAGSFVTECATPIPSDH